MTELIIGDVIEVETIEQKGLVAREVWRRGNVCHIDELKIGVEFTDGERLMVPRDGRGPKWR
ncbi:hypothetical protein [Rhizobium sp. AG207R]|uniref:hypothetical protein n=1 Tax=Rhizobium sp. AG207R TaxID=2802287 RepID=UPI0022AC2EDE|nr:hypothetical protein [Rhizobium sp. AG207R]MCZ3377409.1 hypothetical protein [Rhizobium sp. AG207R]